MGIREKLPVTQQRLLDESNILLREIRDVKASVKNLDSMAGKLDSLLAAHESIADEEAKLRKDVSKIRSFYHTRQYGNWYSADLPFSLRKNSVPEWQRIRKLFHKANDFPRLYSLALNINQIIYDGVEGSFAELGVYKGYTSAVLMYYCEAYDRKLFMFDTFEGFSKNDLQGVDADKTVRFEDTSLEAVQNYVGGEIMPVM